MNLHVSRTFKAADGVVDYDSILEFRISEASGDRKIDYAETALWKSSMNVYNLNRSNSHLMVASYHLILLLPE